MEKASVTEKKIFCPVRIRKWTRDLSATNRLSWIVPVRRSFASQWITMSVLEIMTYRFIAYFEMRYYFHGNNCTVIDNLISQCYILSCHSETTIRNSKFSRWRYIKQILRQIVLKEQICSFPRDKCGIRAEAERKDLVSIAVRFLVSEVVDMVGSNIQQVNSELRTCAGMRTHIVHEHEYRTDKRRRSGLVRLCLNLRRVLTLGSCPFVPLMCAVHCRISVPHTKWPIR